MYKKLVMFVMFSFLLGMGCSAPTAQDLEDFERSRSGGGVSSETQAAVVNYWPGASTGVERVFTPANGRYLNDHNFFRTSAGVWHLFGITSSDPTGNPWTEYTFIHATATSPSGPWTEQPDIVPDGNNMVPKWAPFVVERSAGQYSMFYKHNDGTTRRADSTDLMTFTDTGYTAPGGRDPMLLKVGSTWYLYSVGANGSCQGQITYSTSTDLINWTSPVALITDPVPSYCWGNVESPHVVYYQQQYYLFVTRTGPATFPATNHDPGYFRTYVFRSTTPTGFTGWSPITQLWGHATEVVLNPANSTYFMSSCGWPSEVGEAQRGLSIASVRWAR
jgi:hypothetical protein